MKIFLIVILAVGVLVIFAAYCGISSEGGHKNDKAAAQSASAPQASAPIFVDQDHVAAQLAGRTSQTVLYGYSLTNKGKDIAFFYFDGNQSGTNALACIPPTGKPLVCMFKQPFFVGSPGVDWWIKEDRPGDVTGTIATGQAK